MEVSHPLVQKTEYFLILLELFLLDFISQSLLRRILVKLHANECLQENNWLVSGIA